MKTKDLFYFASMFIKRRPEFLDYISASIASEIIEDAYAIFQAQSNWTIDGWFESCYHDWAKSYVKFNNEMDSLNEILLS